MSHRRGKNLRPGHGGEMRLSRRGWADRASRTARAAHARPAQASHVRTRVLRRWLSICAVLLMFSTAAPIVALSAASADGAADLQLTVIDSLGTAELGAQVSLTDASNQIYQSTYLNSYYDLTVPAGAYSLSLSSGPSTVDQFNLVVAISFLSKGQVEQVTLTVPVTEVDVDVTDGAGSPVAGATVDTSKWACTASSVTLAPGFVASGYAPPGATVTANSSGVASFGSLPCDAGSSLVLGASASGFITNSVTVSQPVTGSAITVPVTLYSSGVTLSGTVEDQNGAPLAGVGVDINGTTATAVYTGADGSFSVSGPGGPVEIDVRGLFPPGSPNAGGTMWKFTADLTVPSSASGLVITVPIVPLTVNVTDSNNHPVSNVSVSADQTVSPNEGCSGSTVTATLPFGAAAPLIYAYYTFSGVTDTNGNATFGVVACSNLQNTSVHLQPPPGQGLAQQYVPLPTSITGPTTVPVVMAAATPGELKGTLLDSAGVPQAGATVALASDPSYTFTTDGSGTFDLTVPAGAYSLSLSSGPSTVDQFNLVVPSVTLSAGQVEQVTLTVPVTEVDVDVTDGAGSPVAGATVD